MGSSYFGEPNMGNNERVSGSSSRKGKKNNQDKPKQPQRGLGVAQLEKIRLHGQMAYGFHPLHQGSFPSNLNNEDPRVQTPYSSSIPSSSFSYSSSSTSYSASHGFQPNLVIGLPEYERSSMGYGVSQPTSTTRWEQANTIAQPNTTRPLLNLYDSTHIKTTEYRSGSAGSSSHYSESSDTQEPDLELRLSL
ncbi:protein SPEAR1-like [Lotus japonicus]|uniref:protein SPEAR1-like n=1 Tax=Lotus japonicus TaxID=34305 RepID=UPI0025883997|nr:protein SPEAR1-like [Lotus japonicus]